jgi:hypothetical protein
MSICLTGKFKNILKLFTFSADSFGNSSDEIVTRLKVEHPSFTHLSSVTSAANIAPNN